MYFFSLPEITKMNVYRMDVKSKKETVQYCNNNIDTGDEKEDARLISQNRFFAFQELTKSNY